MRLIVTTVKYEDGSGAIGLPGKRVNCEQSSELYEHTM